jgi:Tfp pilus assembly protein PilF
VERARAYMAAVLYSKALQDSEKAIALNPNERNAWLYKAIISEMFGQLGDAELANAYRQFIKLSGPSKDSNVEQARGRLAELDAKLASKSP